VESDPTRSTADLSAEERRRLRRAHENLRSASQELEALVATEPLRHRWEPEPPPPQILAAARAELRRSFEHLTRCHEEILRAPVAAPAAIPEPDGDPAARPPGGRA